MNTVDFKLLAAPFQEDEVEWRIQSAGNTREGKIWAMCLAYIQARAIQNRLDEVVGPDRWHVRYRFMGECVVCELGIEVEENKLIFKEDGSEQTDIESFKGGISGAFKRAAVTWGIGRYLYQLDAGFAQIVERGTKGAQYGKTKDGKEFHWLPPKLPDWALPKKDAIPPQKQATPTKMNPDAHDFERLMSLVAQKEWPKDFLHKYMMHKFGSVRIGALNYGNQFLPLLWTIENVPYTKLLTEINQDKQGNLPV